MDIFLQCLLIFSVRIIDVSMGTLRTVLVVRGRRVTGAFIGFIEILVLFLIVSQALNNKENSLLVAIAYSAGFACGTFVGSWIEEKLAIGSASFNVITKGLRYDLVDVLRKRGFGVSTIVCQGKDDENLMLLIEVDRKNSKSSPDYQ